MAFGTQAKKKAIDIEKDYYSSKLNLMTIVWTLIQAQQKVAQKFVSYLVKNKF